MPQSLSHVIIHIVFSTKFRTPWLVKPVRERAHAYIAAIVRDMGCDCYRAGGVADHVHLAVRLSRTITIAQLVEELKTGSSKWMKTQGDDLKEFTWQRGYSAFSVYYREVDRLLAYIDGQEEHHRQRSFQDEYRDLLVEHGIDFDERYVWD
jgi:REP element-mobilizing transposase RayT